MLGVGTWAGAATPCVQLSANVEIDAETVRLSDLLPSGATMELKEAAGKVELGPAPRAGGVRIFTRKQVLGSVESGAALLETLTVPQEIVVRRRAWPISQDSVNGAIKGAMQQQGWSADGLAGQQTWQWPSTMMAADPGPELEVQGMEWDLGHHGLQVRLGCVRKALCSSFLVRVPIVHALLEGKLHRPFLVPARPHPATARTATKHPAGPVLTQAGKLATLVLEGEGVRIKLKVVCLGQGRLSQQVRVRDTASRTVYVAEIMGPGLLRANF